jgi:zinc protease
MGQPATVADAAIRRRVFGAHAYGEFEAGTPASIKAMSQPDLVRFHDRLFLPNNATLFVVGDVTAAQAESRALARFGGWQRGDAPPAVPIPTAAGSGAGPQITIVDRPGAAQTEVRIGLLTPGYSDPGRQVARVASAVLGLGQFESRLTREIRVKRGLTYGASSFFDRKARGGMFEISTFTKNQSTGQVVHIALDEARKLQTEPVPADELQERKQFLNGSFAVSVATSTGVLQRLAQAVLYGAGVEDLTAYVPTISAVTPEQIQGYMRGLPLDRPQVVLVGDAKVIEPQVRSIGTVTTIPAGSLNLQSPTLRGPAPGVAR